jgi:hypothetical protein
MLMVMHDSERRGVLILNGKAMTDDMIARCIGLDNQTFNQTITTLLTIGVAEREPETGAIFSRRMVRDEQIRKIRKDCGSMGGNPNLVIQKTTTGDNQKPTPSSSSSSSSSSTKANTLAVTSSDVPAARGKILGSLPCAGGKSYEVCQDDLTRDAVLFPGVDVQQEYRNMKAWLMASPKRQKTIKGVRQFMASWLTRAQDKPRSGDSHGANGQHRTALFPTRTERNLAAAASAARHDTEALDDHGGEPTSLSDGRDFLDILARPRRVSADRPRSGDSGTVLEGAS